MESAAKKAKLEQKAEEIVFPKVIEGEDFDNDELKGFSKVDDSNDGCFEYLTKYFRGETAPVPIFKDRFIVLIADKDVTSKPQLLLFEVVGNLHDYKNMTLTPHKKYSMPFRTLAWWFVSNNGEDIVVVATVEKFYVVQKYTMSQDLTLTFRKQIQAFEGCFGCSSFFYNYEYPLLALVFERRYIKVLNCTALNIVYFLDLKEHCFQPITSVCFSNNLKTLHLTTKTFCFKSFGLLSGEIKNQSFRNVLGCLSEQKCFIFNVYYESNKENIVYGLTSHGLFMNMNNFEVLMDFKNHIGDDNRNIDIRWFEFNPFTKCVVFQDITTHNFHIFDVLHKVFVANIENNLYFIRNSKSWDLQVFYYVLIKDFNIEPFDPDGDHYSIFFKRIQPYSCKSLKYLARHTLFKNYSKENLLEKANGKKMKQLIFDENYL